MDPMLSTDMTYEPDIRPRGARRSAFMVAPRSAGASLGDQQAEMGWAGFLRANAQGVGALPARAASTLRIQRHMTCPYCRSQAYEITFAWTVTGRLVRGTCKLCGAHGEWHHLKAAA